MRRLVSRVLAGAGPAIDMTVRGHDLRPAQVMTADVERLRATPGHTAAAVRAGS